MQGRHLVLVATAIGASLSAAPAFAHDEGGATRLPTARELAAFDARRSAAARAVDTAARPVRVGAFGAPFAEPTIDGRRTSATCVDRPGGRRRCKPAAGAVNVLPNGRILYWNALEGTENIKTSIVSEYGAVALNDQSRLLTLRGPSWRKPSPEDAGANPNGHRNAPIVPGGNPEKNNDGALSCSDQTYLPAGRILATGGTAYYQDPPVPGTHYGV